MAALRKIDGRALWAAFFALLGTFLDIDSTAREEANEAEGLLATCAYYDIADMFLGPMAIAMGLGALIFLGVGKRRLATAAMAIAGVIGGVLVTMHGFGGRADGCETTGADPARWIVLGLVAVAAVIAFVDRGKPKAPPALAALYETHVETYPEGIRRCRNCGFTSNGVEESVCRVCGSDDLEDAVETASAATAPPISET